MMGLDSGDRKALNPEVQLLLEKLELPPAFAGLYRTCEDRAARNEFFSNADFALRLLRDSISRGKVASSEAVKEVLRVLLVFACSGADEEEKSSIVWTTEPLSLLASKAIDELAWFCGEDGNCGSTADATERFITRHLQELLSEIHSQLRLGTTRTLSESFYKKEKEPWDSTFDLVRALQLTWLIQKVGYPHLGQQLQIVVPCILTALDHFSPPIKMQGLRCVVHLAQSTSASELRWHKDVLLDAVRQLIVGSQKFWPLLVKSSIVLVTRIEAHNPRSEWHATLLKEMFGQLELHQNDLKQARIWLVEVRPLFQALGLLLVAHFKRLFQLLFYWLRNSDKATSLEVLSTLRFIIPLTWPRIPFHAKRILDELMRVHRVTKDPETRSSVMETASLLMSCIDPETKTLVLGDVLSEEAE